MSFLLILLHRYMTLIFLFTSFIENFNIKITICNFAIQLQHENDIKVFI